MIFGLVEIGADDFEKRSSTMRSPVVAVLVLRYLGTNGERRTDELL
jgi:hypothetical protein